jgi:hypothetical protein
MRKPSCMVLLPEDSKSHTGDDYRLSVNGGQVSAEGSTHGIY